MTRTLGVDIGLKRTGLAMSDELGLSVRGLPIHTTKSRNEDVEHLISLCKSHAISVIVLGYPVLALSENEGFMAKRASGLKAALEIKIAQELIDIKVILIDERYSSKQAMMRLIESGIKQKKRKAMLDSEVARILVETYLAGQNNESNI